MTINTIVNLGGPTGGVKPGRSAGDDGWKSDGERGRTDRVEVSGQAQALHEAGNDGRLDVIRDRVRQGYYLQQHILDQLVDGLAQDLRAAGRG